MRSVLEMLLGSALLAVAAGAAAQSAVRVVEGFDDPGRWRLQVSEGAQARLNRVGGADGGRAVCLQADFGDLPGSARLSAPLSLGLAPGGRLISSSRGQAAQAQLSLQLVDGQGRRIGGHRHGRELGSRWQPQYWSLSDFSDAAGKAAVLPQAISRVELHLAAPAGGKAQWCLDNLAVQASDEDADEPFKPVALADTATALQQRMVDGRSDTLWISSGVKQQTVSLDLGRERDVGGLLVQWAAGLRADRYRVQASSDGRRWQQLRRIDGASGSTDRLRLGPLQARYLRLDLEDGPNWRYGIVDLLPQPAAFGRSTEAFLAEVGKQWPAGILPPSLSDGPLEWTVLGAEGALAPAWFSAQGGVEVVPGSFSLEPLLQIDGQWLSASQMTLSPQWQAGAARSHWLHGQARLEIVASSGHDGHGRPWLRLRYRLFNPDRDSHRYALALALRPFQLHPAGRLGDLAGGAGWIASIDTAPDRVEVNGRTALLAITPADAQFASHFDAGLAMNLLRGAQLPATRHAEDEQGLASAALVWRKELAANDSQEWEVWLPMAAAGQAPDKVPGQFQISALAGEGWVLPGSQGQALVMAWQAAVGRMRAERAGPWLRRDSRLAIGAGNRDAMAIADALLQADQVDAVVPWLLARIASGSTANCDLLAHWAQSAARVQAAHGWTPDQQAALQPWLHNSLARYQPTGACAAQAQAPATAAALGLLLPVPAPAAPAVADPPPALAAGSDTGTALAVTPGAAAPDTLLQAVVVPGEPVSLAQRQQIWEGAQALLDDQLPAGWQRWVRGQSRGQRDARQAAVQVHAIAAIIVQEQDDHLRLLPGLPAAAWRDGRLQVPGLLTRWGRLGLQGRREGDAWVLQFAPGLQAPPAGLVLDWPFDGVPGTASADGLPLTWQGGRLHLTRVPGELRLELPAH